MLRRVILAKEWARDQIKAWFNDIVGSSDVLLDKNVQNTWNFQKFGRKMEIFESFLSN